MGDVFYSTGMQLPGTVYRVVRHLATGGMGSVYDVEDVTVGKRYVLKTLHPQLVSREDLARRMEAEARTLAKLQHPNIVDVFTAGVTADGSKMPFYVMERLNGQNLRVLLEKRGVIELAHALRIAIDVLDALEHAHENSVIHRDVKPENIFLHRHINGTTITKLLDFGIMRLLDRKRSHTQGKFIGTLRYASPEQIMGGDLGPGTDIYSLGVVLYEMIAGRGPFDDAGDAYAIGHAHAQEPPPPLSLFTQVPPHVEALVMSALAKTPDARPRDCFTFASELRRMLREEEAAPRSATAVNVLSSVPVTRAADGALDGTVPAPSYTPPGPLPAAGMGAAGTQIGMPEPSRVGPPLDVAGAGGAAPFDATLLAAEGGGVGGSGAGGAPAPRGGPAEAAPLDRAAETRTSVPFGHTQRLASNGTEIDGFEARPEELQAALGQREPLVVPPIAAPIADAPLVFGRVHDAASVAPFGTGPLAGEAATRPPERSVVVPLVGAVAIGLAMVGGAVFLVKSRLAREASTSAAAAAAATAPAPASSSAAPAAATAPAPASSSAATATAVAMPTSSVPAAPAPPTASAAPARPLASAPPAPPASARPRPAARPPSPAATAATKPARVPGFDD